MTKTFLYGLVVALEPRRGAAILTVLMDKSSRLMPDTFKHVHLSKRAWVELKERRAPDEILVKRVAIDQQPKRFAFTVANDRQTLGDSPEWYPAESL